MYDAAGEPCGISLVVLGSVGEVVTIVAVDPKGIVRVRKVTIPAAGRVKVSV